MQRERIKANLDRDSAKAERDQGNLERDQAILERDQAWCDLDMLNAEYQQDQRVQENEANCEQLKTELEKIQTTRIRQAKGKRDQDYKTSSCRLKAGVTHGGG